MKILNWCNRHHGLFRCAVFFLSLCPSLFLFSAYWNKQLGVNPFETLILFSGQASIIFTMITLAITPCRRWLSAGCRFGHLSYGKRLSDWNFLVRTRRMMGLFAFYYACIHLCIYLYFEMDFDWNEIYYDIKTRLFLWFGMIAWLLMLALAITSPTVIQRKMGKYWRRLHRGMYILSICALIHLWIEAKLIEPEQIIYASIIGIFLSHRLVVLLVRRWRRTEDTGMIATR